jgi:hypothetical protein
VYVKTSSPHKCKQICSLSSVANFWPKISAKSTEKFCRAHYFFIEAILQSLLAQNINKNTEQSFSANNEGFCVNNARLKSSATLRLLYEKSAKDSAADFSGR